MLPMLPPSRMSSTPHRRPLGIILLVAIYCLATLLSTVAAFGLATGSFLGLLSTIPPLLVFLAASLLLVIGLLIGWMAFGLWRLKRNTYRLAIGFHGLALLSTLISMLQTGSLSPRDTSVVLFDIVALVYLLLPAVRAAFQPPAAGGTIEQIG